MQLATLAWFISEQRFQQLDIGGYHNGRIPILHSKPLIFAPLPCSGIKVVIRVMFQDVLLTKDVPEDGCTLLDDGCERNSIDNTLKAVHCRMA